MCALESFSPLYKTLKFVGIFPFEINCKNCEVRVGWKNAIWMIFWMLVLACLIFWNVRRGASEPGEKSLLIVAGWHFLLIFELLSVFFLQFWSLVNRKCAGNFFRLLGEFDEHVSRAWNQP